MRGGYRPGAGRPKGTTKVKKKVSKKIKKAPALPEDIVSEAVAENLDPLTYMLKVMNDPGVDAARRDRMAVSAAPFCHSRKGEGAGKKESQKEKAEAAGKGKFTPRKAPVLTMIGK